jgi:hypothetical protein
MIQEGAEYDRQGVGSISNKDKADVKQLKWEMDRHSDYNNGKGSKSNYKKSNKSFSKQKHLATKKNNDKKGTRRRRK